MYEATCSIKYPSKETESQGGGTQQGAFWMVQESEKCPCRRNSGTSCGNLGRFNPPIESAQPHWQYRTVERVPGPVPTLTLSLASPSPCLPAGLYHSWLQFLDSKKSKWQHWFQVCIWIIVNIQPAWPHPQTSWFSRRALKFVFLASSSWCQCCWPGITLWEWWG